MSWLARQEMKSGYNDVVPRDDARLEMISFGVARLARGESYTEELGDEEAVLVILGGRCDLDAGESWKNLGRRRDVFSGKATGAYIPPGVKFTLTGAAAGVCEVAVSRAPAKQKGTPRVIRPEEVKVRTAGALNWKRVIHDIADLSVPAERLVVGETFNPPGNWSSYPPHRHEIDDLPDEVKMEELYHFRVSPKQGFGFQRLYTDDLSVEEAIALRDADTVVIPRGYHPVAAAPGYRLYYLWILAGNERVLLPRDDPNHAWVKDAEHVVG